MIFWKRLSPITRAFLQGFLLAPLIWGFLTVYLLLGDLLFVP